MQSISAVLQRALPHRDAWISLVYLAAMFGLGRLDLPSWGFLVVALLAAGMGVWIMLKKAPSGIILWLGIAVAVAMALPAVLGLIRGQQVSTGQFAFALGVGVAVWAAALVPPGTIRWSALAVLALACWAGLLAGLVAETGLLSYGLFYEPAQDRTLFGLIQLRGVMPHPNTMGIFAGLAIVLGMRQVITDHLDGLRDKGRFLALTLGVVLPAVITLVWTQSRTSLFAALAGLVVAVLPLQRRSWHWVAPVVAMGAALMVTVPVIIAETVGYDFNGRGIPWALAQQEFEANPLVGRGPEFLSEQYRAPLELLWQPETAHNMLMQAIGESGLLGLLSLAVLILVMCLIAVQTVGVDRQWALIVVVMFCVLAGQESSLSLPVRSALVVQFAILASSAVLYRQATSRHQTTETTPSTPGVHTPA
jgi:O-antigen ligase